MLQIVASDTRPALLLLLLLLTACATQRPSTRPSTTLGGAPFHDAVAEWSADAARQAPPLSAAAPVLRRAPRPTSEFFDDLPESRPPRFSRPDIERIREVQPIVQAAAYAQAVAPDLVNGIIWVESRFQARARSARGAGGLMQLMPHTGREVARSIGKRYDPYDPDFSIHAGTYYYARMLERFDGNMTLALAAYNAGPATVDGWVRFSAPLPAASRAYVANVFDAARVFRARAL